MRHRRYHASSARRQARRPPPNPWLPLATPEGVLLVYVWYVQPVGDIPEPITFIYDPRLQDVVLVPGDFASSRQLFVDSMEATTAQTGIHFELRETHGVEGLAATDRQWDGKPTFRCNNCDTEHDVHKNVAQVLYQHYTSQHQPLTDTIQ